MMASSAAARGGGEEVRSRSCGTIRAGVATRHQTFKSQVRLSNHIYQGALFDFFF